MRIPYKKLNVQHEYPGGGGIGGNLTPDTVDDYRKKGKIPEDYWLEDRDDMTPVGRKATERTGYPTQKPLALLDRIIKAASNEGDIVLDPFCGCATTCVSAERWGRQWIGIDIAEKAVWLVESRLQASIDKMKLYHPGDVIHRTDQPHRTDMGPLPPYKVHLKTMYGDQGGDCGGCGVHFPKMRNLTIDHIVPRSHGGTDHIENLWLLCGACNSSKGTKSQVEFLRERMSRKATIAPWLLKTRAGERLFEART